MHTDSSPFHLYLSLCLSLSSNLSVSLSVLILHCMMWYFGETYTHMYQRNLVVPLSYLWAT